METVGLNSRFYHGTRSNQSCISCMSWGAGHSFTCLRHAPHAHACTRTYHVYVPCQECVRAYCMHVLLFVAQSMYNSSYSFELLNSCCNAAVKLYALTTHACDMQRMCGKENTRISGGLHVTDCGLHVTWPRPREMQQISALSAFQSIAVWLQHSTEVRALSSVRVFKIHSFVNVHTILFYCVKKIFFLLIKLSEKRMMSSDGEGEHGHTHSSVERLKSLGGKRSFNEDGESSSKVDYPAAKRSNIDSGVFVFREITKF